MVRAIVTVLPGRIADAHIEQSRRVPTENLSALDYLMRGNHLASKRGGNHDRAIAAYQKAIELDPRYREEARNHNAFSRLSRDDWFRKLMGELEE